MSSPQYSIDDVALNFNSEPVVPIVPHVPVLLYNTKQCLTELGLTVCVAARTYTAISDSTIVAASQAALNDRALVALNYSTHNQQFKAAGFSVGSLALQQVTIPVSNMLGTVTKITLEMDGFASTIPGNLGLLLQAPGGAVMMLTRGIGGFAQSVSGLNIIFDDAAGIALPLSAPLVSGRYTGNSTDYNTSVLPPGPAGPYSSTLAHLNGVVANGTWSVWAQNFAGGGPTITASALYLNIHTT